MSLTIHAPAKVNLYLHVTGKRPDGYHLLESLVAFTEVCDTITITASDKYKFTISGSYASALASEDNIISNAVALLADRVGIKPEIAINLQKEIPLGAGLGGGSSDAAAMLHALITYWDITMDEPSLMALGLQLGADVPVLLKGKASFVSGIGEHVKRVEKPFMLHAVLVNPAVHLATPHVFKQRTGAFTPPEPDVVTVFNSHDIFEFLAVRHNDLEPAAIGLQPIISKVLDTLKSMPGCRISRMSGSGSTCFGLFDNQQAAKQAAEIITKTEPGWWVRATDIN